MVSYVDAGKLACCVKRGLACLIILAVSGWEGRAEGFPGNGEAVITERGPHHAVFSRLSQYVNSYGEVVTRSNGYVALATGMHYLQDGVWTESKVNGQTGLQDDVLDFGALRIGTGSAFPTDDPETPIQTGKLWEVREGRQLMVEQVDYVTILPFLNRLPPLQAKVDVQSELDFRGDQAAV